MNQLIFQIEDDIEVHANKLTQHNTHQKQQTIQSTQHQKYELVFIFVFGDDVEINANKLTQHNTHQKQPTNKQTNKRIAAKILYGIVLDHINEPQRGRWMWLLAPLPAYYVLRYAGTAVTTASNGRRGCQVPIFRSLRPQQSQRKRRTNKPHEQGAFTQTLRGDIERLPNRSKTKQQLHKCASSSAHPSIFSSWPWGLFSEELRVTLLFLTLGLFSGELNIHDFLFRGTTSCGQAALKYLFVDCIYVDHGYYHASLFSGAISCKRTPKTKTLLQIVQSNVDHGRRYI